MNIRFFPVLALMVAAGIFFAYVSPTWSGSIAETKDAIALDNEALVAANQYTAQQNELASSRAAIDPSLLNRLATFLPDSVDNVGLILDLNSLGARSGLSLSNIDVVTTAVNSGSGSSAGALPVRGTNPVGSVDLTLNALGSYTALQNFLQAVEKSARLLDVRDIIVKGSNTGVYTYQMNVRLYWLR
jgi:Tfp pilus assembly protein PilO